MHGGAQPPTYPARYGDREETKDDLRKVLAEQLAIQKDQLDEYITV